MCCGSPPFWRRASRRTNAVAERARWRTLGTTVPARAGGGSDWRSALRRIPGQPRGPRCTLRLFRFDIDCACDREVYSDDRRCRRAGADHPADRTIRWMGARAGRAPGPLEVRLGRRHRRRCLCPTVRQGSEAGNQQLKYGSELPDEPARHCERTHREDDRRIPLPRPARPSWRSRARGAPPPQATSRIRARTPRGT